MTGCHQKGGTRWWRIDCEGRGGGNGHKKKEDVFFPPLFLPSGFLPPWFFLSPPSSFPGPEREPTTKDRPPTIKIASFSLLVHPTKTVFSSLTQPHLLFRLRRGEEGALYTCIEHCKTFVSAMRLPPSRNTATKQHESRDHKHSSFPPTPSPRGQAKLLAASKEKKISLSPPVYTKRKRLRPTLLLLRFRVRPIRRRRLQIQTRSRVSSSLPSSLSSIILGEVIPRKPLSL